MTTLTRKRSLLTALLAAAAALLAIAAGSLSAQRIAVRPLVVPVGDTIDHVDLAWQSQPAHATAVVVAVTYDSIGRLQLGQSIAWRSADTTIATVAGTTANGIVRARGFGTTMITATWRGIAASIVACIYGAKYSGGVVVTQDGAKQIPAGQTRQFTARSNSGVAYAAPCVHWSLTDSSSATITRRGLVTARRVTTADLDVRAFIGVP